MNSVCYVDFWYFHIDFQIAVLLHEMLTKLATFCVVGCG